VSDFALMGVPKNGKNICILSFKVYVEKGEKNVVFKLRMLVNIKT
jgi:hypothetical protein